MKGEEGEGEKGDPSSWKMEVEADTLSVSQQPSVMDTGLPTPPPPLPPPNPPCDLCPCAKTPGGRYTNSPTDKGYYPDVGVSTGDVAQR